MVPLKKNVEYGSELDRTHWMMIGLLMLNAEGLRYNDFHRRTDFHKKGRPLGRGVFNRRLNELTELGLVEKKPSGKWQKGTVYVIASVLEKFKEYKEKIRQQYLSLTKFIENVQPLDLSTYNSAQAKHVLKDRRKLFSGLLKSMSRIVFDAYRIGMNYSSEIRRQLYLESLGYFEDLISKTVKLIADNPELYNPEEADPETLERYCYFFF